MARELGTFLVGNGPAALAFDGESIWVANIEVDTVGKLTPLREQSITGQYLSTICLFSAKLGEAGFGVTWAGQATTLDLICFSI